MATPLARFAVPSLVVSEAKETAPVGLDPLTVAVKVIWSFTFPALGDAFRLVVVVACPMVTPAAADVLAVLLLSPA